MPEPADSIFKRHPRLTIGLAVGLMIFAVLAVVEIGLRLSGETPGMIDRHPRVQLVDSLFTVGLYETDSFGIFHYSPVARTAIERYLKDSTLTPEDIRNLPEEKLEYSLRLMAADFKALKNDTVSEFGQMVASINKHRTKYLKPLTINASRPVDYAEQPINNEGFRSIQFRSSDHIFRKVLLLGDSYTFGLTATPLYQSFADRLLARGFTVYNTGIVTADPAQYAAIARQYIPKLKPKAVIVNYYIGNDVMFHERKPLPQKPPFFATNAGWLKATPRGPYLDSPEEAYDYVKARLVIPDQETKLFNWLCAQTVIGSRLWKLLAEKGRVGKLPERWQAYEDSTAKLKAKKNIAERYLIEIDSICRANGAKLIVSVIPKFTFEKDVPLAERLNFKQTPYVTPQTLKPEDFMPEPDGHFTTEGHRKYADFLESELKRVGVSAKRYELAD